MKGCVEKSICGSLCVEGTVYEFRFGLWVEWVVPSNWGVEAEGCPATRRLDSCLPPATPDVLPDQGSRVGSPHSLPLLSRTTCECNKGGPPDPIFLVQWHAGSSLSPSFLGRHWGCPPTYPTGRIQTQPSEEAGKQLARLHYLGLPDWPGQAVADGYAQTHPSILPSPTSDHQ